MPQEVPGLSDNLGIVHHERMGHRQREMVRHTVKPGVRYRDLAIVRLGQHGREDQIDAAGAGNDPDIKIRRPEPIGHAGFAGAQLQPRRSVDQFESHHIAQCVDDLAALIGRAKHDHTPQAADPLSA
ncbi:MAG: hypothetical protein MI794_16010 [Pseudomonadales bacterium]|nr:hypothetical protein [Pseudomonadales bacterium]